MKNKNNIAFNFKDHIPEMVFKISSENEYLILHQNFINIDSQNYLLEVKSLLKYFYYFKHTNSKIKLISTILNYFWFSIVFYYYQDSLFDVSIHLKNKGYSEGNYNITRKKKYINLETSLNSSILSKSLKEDSRIKKIIYLNNDGVFNYPHIHISFSTNTLTIDWSRIIKGKHSEYFKILLELWPGLILRLERLEDWYERQLNRIQRLLIYYKRSFLCWKLYFSKVVIHINIDKIRNIEFFKKKK